MNFRTVRPDFGFVRPELVEGPSQWLSALREGAIAGSIASVLSTIALAIAGKRQAGSVQAPINAVSHWLWGDEALHQDHTTLRHTLTGLLTQHAASIFWATLYALAYGRRPEAKRVPQAIAGAAATTAIAYIVDYKVVPKRLTPGYEHRLDSRGMFAVYAALAAGLALGAIALRDRSTRL